MTEEQLKALLADMSLDEKVGQMVQLTANFIGSDTRITGPMGSVEIPPEEVALCGSVLGTAGAKRLRELQEQAVKNQPHHIPMLFMLDVINGHQTIFPTPLAQGCSFEPKLSEKAAEIAAKEAAVSGVHVTFAPMADLVRDARWGRVMESPGEDPYLDGCFAKAMVQGFQGPSLAEYGRVSACLKHFAGYGYPEGGREYDNVELSERTFREDFLNGYRGAIQAGCRMAMTSFNTMNRIPSSANRWLMRGILRKELGFDGVLISDYSAIEELIPHGIAADKREAAKLAIEAGVDIDMMSDVYLHYLGDLVRSGEVEESLVDEAVMRILKLKNELGLFENPFAGMQGEEPLSAEAKKTALALACESSVLLKNDDMLPLKPERKVFWGGPYVESRELLSRWAIFGRYDDVETIREVLKARKMPVRFLPECEILTEEERRLWQAENCRIQDSGEQDKEIPEICVNSGKQYATLDEIEPEDTVVLVLGEHEAQSGEAASRAFLDLPEGQQKFFDAVAGRTSHIVTVILSGRPLDIRKIAEKSQAVLFVWRPGTMGAEAVVRLVYGEETPSGKLSVSIPWCVGQVPVSYWDVKTGHRMVETNPENRFTSRYMDIPNEPLYPFGFGLSYTEFTITPPIFEKQEREDKIDISCKVKNVGEVPGAEVVQCYVETLCAPVVRPDRELIRFRKIFLLPGEEQEVKFTVNRKELAFYGENIELIDGDVQFRFIVGNSSRSEAGSILYAF